MTRRWICGMLMFAVTGLAILPTSAVVGATTTEPQLLLVAKLVGKPNTPITGKAGFAALPDGTKGLKVEVSGLKLQANKTVSVAIGKPGDKVPPFVHIKLDANGNGSVTLKQGDFPVPHPDDVCHILEDTLAHGELLAGAFKKPL